jgi:hypothetical protein
MAEMNLSQGLLERLPQRHPWSLLALPVNGIVWSDWSSRRRLLAALVKTGYRFRLYRNREESALARRVESPRRIVLRQQEVKAK